MTGAKGLFENSGMSCSFWKLVWKVPLHLKLDHRCGSIEVGFKGLAFGHLIKKMVEMCLDEGPISNVIKRMQGFYQRDPFQLHSLRFVGNTCLFNQYRKKYMCS